MVEIDNDENDGVGCLVLLIVCGLTIISCVVGRIFGNEFGWLSFAGCLIIIPLLVLIRMALVRRKK